MKNLLSIMIVTVLLVMISGFKMISHNQKSGRDQGRIEVIFNRYLEFNDLVKIKLDMAEHGIILDYKKLEFDDYGKLRFISFQVDCKDGFSGSATNGPEELYNQTRFGFYRDYTENVESPFGTGTL